VKERLTDRAYLLELFAAGNMAFLALDIYIAHLANAFANPLEWIPVVFSSLGALLLVPGLLGKRAFRNGAGRSLGMVVGWASVGLGLAGMVLHLKSGFFAEQTLQHLVYSAPFVAPLAYTAVGLMLLMNRLVDPESVEWGWWVVFLTMGGFANNMGLSMLDHAQNGFFDWHEWIGVAAAAYASAFLLLVLVWPADARLRRWTAVVLVLQIVVGIVGAGLHLVADLAPGVEADLASRLIWGAPVFAPLLFVDVALLGFLGLWHLAAVQE